MLRQTPGQPLQTRAFGPFLLFYRRWSARRLAVRPPAQGRRHCGLRHRCAGAGQALQGDPPRPRFHEAAQAWPDNAGARPPERAGEPRVGAAGWGVARRAGTACGIAISNAFSQIAAQAVPVCTGGADRRRQGVRRQRQALRLPNLCQRPRAGQQVQQPPGVSVTVDGPVTPLAARAIRYLQDRNRGATDSGARAGRWRCGAA